MIFRQVRSYDLEAYYPLYVYKCLPGEQEIKEEILWKVNYPSKVSELAENLSQGHSLGSGRLGATAVVIIFIV